MPLQLPDVVRLFDVTETKVRTWINDDNLPCDVVDDRYQFNRADLLEWATLRKLDVSPTIFEDVNGNATAVSTLASALARGGIAYNVKAPHKRALLRTLVDELQLPDDFDRDVLLQLLLAREALGSTALEDGVAVPHPRRPIVLGIDHALVRLTFLAEPLDFEAPDGKPVDTLFTMVCPTVHEHLQLLARLATVLKDEKVRRALKSRAPQAEIYQAVAEAERGAAIRVQGAR